MPNSPVAPELAVSQWFNTDDDLSLARLRGRVVVIEAFQMLCPGCVAHGLPQAQRVQQVFGDELVVLGLHTVFEHHDAMTPLSLEAFLHEYRITFPVGVDLAEEGIDQPVTMRRYGLRGTPSLVVVDREGRLRVSEFGHVDDIALGATVARIIDEPVESTGELPAQDSRSDDPGQERDGACDNGACVVPATGRARARADS